MRLVKVITSHISVLRSHQCWIWQDARGLLQDGSEGMPGDVLMHVEKLTEQAVVAGSRLMRQKQLTVLVSELRWQIACSRAGDFKVSHYRVS